MCVSCTEVVRRYYRERVSRQRKKEEKKEKKEVCMCTTNLLVGVISYTRPYVVELCRRYYQFYPPSLSYKNERLKKTKMKDKIK
jgi:hypothetical protein